LKTKIILLSIFSCFFLTTYSQIECGTPMNSPNIDYSEIIEGRGVYQPNEGPYCINVYFHIVRQSNGTGGFNPNQIDDLVDDLNSAFNPHNIYIANFGVGFINNSSLFTLHYDFIQKKIVEFEDLILVNNNPNAINFYIVNNIEIINGATGVVSAAAEGILSTNLVIGKNFVFGSEIPSHEIGHCLNLFHTHHGTVFEFPGDPNQCPENINGSNCHTCGDYVCDTPADPGLSTSIINGNVNTSNCTYTGGGGYNPDVKNIMSYSGICKEHFSYGQGRRMRDALQESNILQNIISTQCDVSDVVSDDVVCANIGTVFTITGSTPPFQWSVSPNMTIIQNNGNSITVVSNNYHYSGYGYVEVTHSGGTIIKEVWLGKPDIPASIYGPELVNSGAIVNYQGGVAPGATSYQWWLPYPYDVVSPIDYFNDNWQMWPNNTRFNSHVFTGYGEHSGYVQVMGVNKCGIGPAQYIQVSHDNNGGGSGPLPIVSPYPNAADDSFTLDFSEYPTGTYYIYIYDIYGILKYSGVTSNTVRTINTINLPNGLYFLNYQNGQEIIQQQLLIQH
jgi:hypothetical protein